MGGVGVYILWAHQVPPQEAPDGCGRRSGKRGESPQFTQSKRVGPQMGKPRLREEAFASIADGNCGLSRGYEGRKALVTCNKCRLALRCRFRLSQV